MAKNISPPQIITQDDLDKHTQAWMRMVDCIAHDMTTPLAGMRMTGQAFKNVLPELIEGYKFAASHHAVKPNSILTQPYLEILGSAATRIDEQIDKIQEFLNLLHPYNQKLLTNATDPNLHIRTCIEQALKNYPFTDEKQRSLAHLDCRHDFSFHAETFFVQHLFLNLIENALSCIEKAGKGEIYIYTEQQNQYHLLHFKNTAGNMDENSASYALRRFFLKHHSGITPGLGFCRLKWLQMGGDITYHVVPDQYTDFEVKFLIA